MAGRKTGGVGREVHPGRAKKAEKRKPMTYQQSLAFAENVARMVSIVPICSPEKYNRTMSGLIDLTGRTFGRVTVIRRNGNSSYHQPSWLCVCSCGENKIIAGCHLRSGSIQSCGCLKAERISKANRTHGHTSGGKQSKEYMIYHGMKARCYNPSHITYPSHGARGITVCREWLDSFERFFVDMGPCPKGMSIERVNNDLGYSKGNCVWATTSVQANNMRNNRKLTAFGETKNIGQWAKAFGLQPRKMSYLVNTRGFSVERIADMCQRKDMSR